jgi:hypothetical protein
MAVESLYIELNTQLTHVICPSALCNKITQLIKMYDMIIKFLSYKLFIGRKVCFPLHRTGIFS